MAITGLDLHRLCYFVTFAGELDFVRAADLAHMTQSPLSRQASASVLFRKSPRMMALAHDNHGTMPEFAELATSMPGNGGKGGPRRYATLPRRRRAMRANLSNSRIGRALC